MTHLDILFLAVEELAQLHDDCIGHEGGSGGLRDAGLLESAVLMPQAAFGGQYPHPNIPAMAAAYPISYLPGTRLL